MYKDNEFLKLKDTSSVKYIQELIGTINKSQQAVSILNKMTDFLLNKAQETIDTTDDIAIIIELKDSITPILDNIKEIFKLAKDAPNWINTLTDLEKRLNKDVQEIEELYGGKSKAYREDPNNIVDFNKPTIVTELRFT